MASAPALKLRIFPSGPVEMTQICGLFRMACSKMCSVWLRDMASLRAKRAGRAKSWRGTAAIKISPHRPFCHSFFEREPVGLKRPGRFTQLVTLYFSSGRLRQTADVIYAVRIFVSLQTALTPLL